jgi:hypothetical protein
MLDRHLKKTLQDFAYGSGRITILTGAGNLPNPVVWEVKNRDGIIIDINIEENPWAVKNVDIFYTTPFYK